MYYAHLQEEALSLLKNKKHTLKTGDLVRVAIHKKGFEKASNQTFTDELFTVTKILKTYPLTYQISDSTGRIIAGSYYQPELQVVDKFLDT